MDAHLDALSHGRGSPQGLDGRLEECRLLLLNLEGEVSSLSRGGQQAGSIGIALEGTMVSGVMPFGPAFDKIEAGDVILSVDGVDVTPGTIVSAIAGEDESEVQLQVRKKLGDELIALDLVRTCSARLLTAHSLAMCVHEVLAQFGGNDQASREHEYPGSSRTKSDEEMCDTLQKCVRLLEDLQQQVTRSEGRQREQMARTQKRMYLQLKQMHEQLMQAEILSGTKISKARPVLRQDHMVREEAALAKLDRETLMAALKGSEAMLGQLEAQLRNALTQLEATEGKLELSLQENKVLLDEVGRLGSKQETQEKVVEELRKLSRSDGTDKDSQAKLVAEIVQLRDTNSLLEDQVGKVSLQIRQAHKGEKEVRDALLQSQEDISQLLRIAEEKETTLQKTVSEKDRISKEHDQACAFADGVKAEMKRLEGLLETLSKRQEMASIVADSLTTERDELRQELTGFKQLCSAQKHMLEESSREVENLRSVLRPTEPKTMELKPSTRPQAMRSSKPREYHNQNGISQKQPAVAAENEMLSSISSQSREPPSNSSVAKKIAGPACTPAPKVVEERREGGYSGGIYSVPKAAQPASRPSSRSPSPGHGRSRSSTPTGMRMNSTSGLAPGYGPMQFMPGLNIQLVMHHQQVSLGSIHAPHACARSRSVSPRTTLHQHNTPASAKDKTAAWLHGLGANTKFPGVADAPRGARQRTGVQSHSVQRK